MAAKLVLRRCKPPRSYKYSVNGKLDIHNNVFEKRPSKSNSIKIIPSTGDLRDDQQHYY